MAAVFDRIVPSRRRERKLQQQQDSAFCPRFGDVQISAPTTGGWIGHASNSSHEAYISNLDKILSGTDAPEPVSRPVSNITFVTARDQLSPCTFRNSPKSSPKFQQPALSPRSIRSVRSERRGLGDIAVSPHQSSRQAGLLASPGSMRSVSSINTRTCGRSHSRGPRQRGAPFKVRGRSASARPAERMPYNESPDSESDAETFIDDTSSICSRNSGFIFDELDQGIEANTPSTSVGTPEFEGMGVSHGFYAKNLISAVQDAECKRLEAEKETENVKKLLAAAQDTKLGKKKKEKEAQKVAHRPWAPVKELVPSLEELWG